MARVKLFNKGDVILTNPEKGFWGIAIVLSEREKTTESAPMCHIAITPLIFQKEVEFSELNFNSLIPLVFERNYTFEMQKRKREPFTKIETCIGVYTRYNKMNFKIIGNINPGTIYNGPLPFNPSFGLETKYPLYGDTKQSLGREAFITWHRKNDLSHS